mgnify:CR=1 FL=1
MKKYIACLLAAILLLTMLPASASAEGGMQACHRVTAKYTDSKQSNKSGIRLWSVKTALTSVDDEINGLAQAYADKIAPTLQAGKANGDKNSRLDVEIRHSKTGLTWMSFLVQARTTYHRDLIAQEFTSRTFDMTTGERILLTDIFPEGSEGWTMLREKLKAQINYYFPDETPDPDAVAQVLSDEGLRNLDFTLHGMSLVIHLSADAFYPEHHTLIETTLFYPDIREYMTEKAQIETDNLSYYKTVALTFDDGPHPEQTAKVLDVLEKYGAKGTFFVIGRNIAGNESVVRRIIDDGHEIGNHTYTHPLRSGSSETLLEEAAKTSELLESTFDYSPVLFRPPGGNISGSMIESICEAGYKCVLWSWRMDTRDWASPPVESVVQTVLQDVKFGDIVLFHDNVYGNSPTAEALEIILPELIDRGYSFVTVSELIAG